MIVDRIDRITAIPERRALAPVPISCKIELTARCPYRCSFCSKSITESDDAEMDRALYSRLIREMREAGVRELGVFFIGESFTCAWLPDAIREAKELGFFVFLTTNGASATPYKLRQCFEAGLDSLKFSVNYYDAQQLQAVARVAPSHWRKSLDNLKAAREIRDAGGYGCEISASSIAFDGEQGQKMQAVVDEIRPYVDQHYFLPLFSMNGAGQQMGKPQPGNPGRLDNMRDPLPCWSVWQAHIDRYGRLIACCFGDDAEGGHIMADLREQHFLSGWNSDKFQALRAKHLQRDVSGTACERCAALG